MALLACFSPGSANRVSRCLTQALVPSSVENLWITPQLSPPLFDSQISLVLTVFSHLIQRILPTLGITPKFLSTGSHSMR